MPRKKKTIEPIGVGYTSKQMKRKKPINNDLLVDITPLTKNQEKFFDAYRDGNVRLAKACQSTIEEIDALRNDVNLAETGGEHPFFSKQATASKKVIGKLIKHDHETLTMLVKAVNRSNDLEKTAAEEGDVMKAVRATRQLVSSVRGHFSERRAVLKKIQ